MLHLADEFAEMDVLAPPAIGGASGRQRLDTSRDVRFDVEAPGPAARLVIDELDAAAAATGAVDAADPSGDQAAV